ncbi:MAG: aminoacyl-tRNA hydrolase [Flavobacteriaceae bacterium CG_4_8_14_3_um_filter_34_10]|nr:aminoacyl-tRNA hydrolase [Flavobacteriia bacterium]OIP51471.1 MAG: aminoacyl-tRNA hydrolase [Flavobacteriaceae bacterium CG2_30_34_30]PIQ17454.1 MAG: aminoacyl-tRNA hydrolase [Flavobacteriaceae bacterium CG18_big_fil_WC_8_21_14_2_50_34_36]PIV49754.1 MAG: aminoacyl-tRNA hydrolase [Flavobacteriaceae bacterium CG02_land_8_20_14_3_00_34_13]PIX10359.1 MAG: aminoacyl-tRNA hydrolase [Flavobacteriaceae bacterium CG_4_8_14_3_um_filter_34_10]PIZ08755.1 MAG: aminoacyl-tRNA hydrolase [Flavobacteriaceae
MLAFFGRILTRKKNALLDEKKPMKKYLIVGLGNIGPKYENTRHNIGFKVLDHFAYKENLVFTPGRLGDIATYKLKGRTFLFLKPSTYMNLSGKAVYYWLDKEKIPLENVLIITDDLNLPFGSIRVKTKGSDGGHNGLKDIQAHLGTTNYNRFRFGIDNEFSRKNQIDFVLGEWEPEEAKQLPERLDLSLEIIKSFVLAGITNTMNLFNGK